MALTVNKNQRVWEAIANFEGRGFSEEVARRICADMSVDEDDTVPADGLVRDHEDLVRSILGVMTSPDILDSLLNGDSEEDPFLGTEKVKSDVVDKYLDPIEGNYCCSICFEDQSTDGVRLSCASSNTSRGDGSIAMGCIGTFCRSCIQHWISTCNASCPRCRQRVVEITPKEGVKKVLRRRLTIAIRKKNL